MYSVVLFSINEPGAYVLKQLLLREELRVELLVTRESQYDLDRQPEAIARQHGIPLTFVREMNRDIERQIETIHPDFIISAWFHLRIPDEVLRLSNFPAVNFHPSYLPGYRGPMPIQHAIINGETKTGLTLHKLESTFDAGDILWQEEVSIELNDTSGDVLKKIQGCTGKAIDELINSASRNDFTGTKQAQDKATYYPKINEQQREILWHQNALSIHNKIRGLSPGPLAFFTLNEVPYTVSASCLRENKADSIHADHARVLEILDSGKKAILACGDNETIELQGINPGLPLDSERI